MQNVEGEPLRAFQWNALTDIAAV